MMQQYMWFKSAKKKELTGLVPNYREVDDLGRLSLSGSYKVVYGISAVHSEQLLPQYPTELQIAGYPSKFSRKVGTTEDLYWLGEDGSIPLQSSMSESWLEGGNNDIVFYDLGDQSGYNQFSWFLVDALTNNGLAVPTNFDQDTTNFVYINADGSYNSIYSSMEAAQRYISNPAAISVQDRTTSNQLVGYNNNGVAFSDNNVMDSAYTDLELVYAGSMQIYSNPPTGSNPDVISTIRYLDSNGDPAYADVRTKWYAGKIWVLLFYCTGRNNIPVGTNLSFREAIFRGEMLQSYTTTPATYPVLPTGLLNHSNNWLYLSENALFKTTCGTLLGNTLNVADYPVFSNSYPIKVRSSSKGDTNFYEHQTAGTWASTVSIDANFAISEVIGTGGIGGGKNVCASQTLPYLGNVTTTCHYATEQQWLYLSLDQDDYHEGYTGLIGDTYNSFELDFSTLPVTDNHGNTWTKGSTITLGSSIYGAPAIASTQAATSYLFYQNDGFFMFGKDDFTIDFRVNLSVGYISTGHTILSGYLNDSIGFMLQLNRGNAILIQDNSTNTACYSTAQLISANVNHHVRVCRGGNTMYMFIDGVLDSAQSCTNFQLSTSNKISIANIYNGYSNDGNYPFVGRLAGFKMVRRCVSTSNFTVPTWPYVL